MNVLITGGTGFVGQHLTKALTDKEHHVYILTRFPDRHQDTENTVFIAYDHPVSQLPNIHSVVNLAGDSLFGYWSSRKKDSIRNSRMETTMAVMNLVKNMDIKPDVFISGSAVGFYGMSEDLMFTEQTTVQGRDFLAKVVSEWEKTASQAETMGIRTIYSRFGVILGEGGAYPLMRMPVKMYAGGKIGNGEQWMSWIHIKDAVRLLLFCLFNDHISGPVNFTAPEPRRNKEFMKELANILNRPYWLPAPASIMTAALGEMSQLITKGQYVLPGKALEHNFQFAYPTLKTALTQLEKENRIN
ncbi:TIGR01777 family oxidoreductase [Virgibacillus siamensis]|uniref:TIGR01777 family oxidoreductase n=1 Tax=Virgibacillus siamensis TaxID=480071 RepID=UPI000984FA11|nr:TIGR01777 family oxidoreductase [Virgibacillus siamensis]